MTLYVDSSAVLKRYLDERDVRVAVDLMASDPVLATSTITEVEVRRNLARLLDGAELEKARRSFIEDLDAFALIAVDATVCSEASRIAEQTLCRSLDSIHVASAARVGTETTLLTFDLRRAQAARSVGLSVVGV